MTACCGTRCTSPTAARTRSSGFVDACHARGLGVMHRRRLQPPRARRATTCRVRPVPELGPATPWGERLNLDDAGPTRSARYIIDSAVRWMRDYHVDGLRLDAVHALVDTTAVHMLEELADRERCARHASGPPAVADRRVRPQRPAADHAARASAASASTPSGTTTSTTPSTPRSPANDRATTPTSAAGSAGEGADERLLPRRHLLVVPRPAARPPARHGHHARLPAGRLHHQNHDQIGNRAAGDRLSAHLDAGQLAVGGTAARRAVHADAVHGRGMGGVHAVAVLHLATPSPSLAAPPPRDATPSSRARLGRRRRSRPARPRRPSPGPSSTGTSSTPASTSGYTSCTGR